MTDKAFSINKNHDKKVANRDVRRPHSRGPQRFRFFFFLSTSHIRYHRIIAAKQQVNNRRSLCMDRRPCVGQSVPAGVFFLLF